MIDLGTPNNPLRIPHVASATYLGIEISLDSYEMRTCKLRMRLAAALRHRLLKVLRAAGLAMRTRLLLYSSCVRSSMLYGQHATGVTPATLRRMNQKDARYVRAITRNFAHIAGVHQQPTSKAEDSFAAISAR